MKVLKLEIRNATFEHGQSSSRNDNKLWSGKDPGIISSTTIESPRSLMGKIAFQWGRGKVFLLQKNKRRALLCLLLNLALTANS